MSLAAVMFYYAVLVYSMEMWGRHHPPPSLEAEAQKDSAEWVDRFHVPDSGAPVSDVKAYLDFVSESGSNGGMIHNYINFGLAHLTRALMGVSGLSLRVGDVDRMQIALGRYVDSLQAHPRWSLDPNRVKPAMLMAVELMGSLNLPYDDATLARIAKAKEAAESLESGQTTLWQRGKIQDFFIQSGYALVLMKQRAREGFGGRTAPTP
jgi:hypothetical protein